MLRLLIPLIFLLSCQSSSQKIERSIYELSPNPTIVENMSILGSKGSTIEKLNGNNNYLFEGKGILSIDKNDKNQPVSIKMKQGKLIFTDGIVKLVSDSLITKIGIEKGHGLIHFNGRKADVGMGQTAVIRDSNLILKSSNQK